MVYINGVQCILSLFLGPETRYVGSGRALTMARHPSIVIPACAHATVFLLGSILCDGRGAAAAAGEVPVER